MGCLRPSFKLAAVGSVWRSIFGALCLVTRSARLVLGRPASLPNVHEFSEDHVPDVDVVDVPSQGEAHRTLTFPTFIPIRNYDDKDPYYCY